MWDEDGRRRLDHWMSGKERTCPKMTDWGDGILKSEKK